jgi:hypothetical protein
VFVILITSVLIYNNVKDNIVYHKLNNLINMPQTEYNLTDIQTKDDELVIVYNKNELHIQFVVGSNNNKIGFSFRDQNGQTVASSLDPAQEGVYTIQDEHFPGFVVSAIVYSDILGFSVMIDGKEWMFTNQTDGTYYYLNLYQKWDKIIKAESAFNGYDSFASSRGYLWSRTIPLLKKYIVLGSGADTFVIAFPQQDYVGLHNAGYEGQINTKPHNMYLQMGVQTGVLSLIAFLIFYGMYFISSIRLYFRGRFQSFFAQIGVGVFIGTFGYMIAGLANDSTVAVAPVFWTLMGLGIAINHKVKPLIKAEIAAEKKQKELKPQKV